MKRKTTKTVF